MKDMWTNWDEYYEQNMKDKWPEYEEDPTCPCCQEHYEDDTYMEEYRKWAEEQIRLRKYEAVNRVLEVCDE